MKKFLAVASVAVLLSGCGETTEQICRKTDQLMRQSEGQGFVDVGWIGCLKQSPSEARLSYEGIKLQLEKEKGVKELPLMSHDEMTKFVNSQPPFDVIYKLGNPDSATFIPVDSNGKPIPETTTTNGFTFEGIVQIRYSTGPKVLANHRDLKNLEDIQGKLAIHKDGTYHFMYLRPLTYGLLGMDDKQISILFNIRNGKVVGDDNISFPKHLWQKWFN